MALPIQEQAKYWGIAAVAFLAGLWLLGDVILPFILGGAIAYILDPVADWMERKGASRVLAVSLITFVAVVVFAVVILLVIPLLIEQATNLVQNLPGIFNSMLSFMTERFPSLLEDGSAMQESLSNLGETIQSRGLDLLNTVVGSLTGLVNVIVLVFFVPVVAFYLLLDWDRMVANIDNLLPRDHAPVIRTLASRIDNTLASFIRGQGTVCLILGTFYAVALMVVGLQFGLVVGFIAGLISFIPFVGAIFGGILAIGLAVFQFWGEWIWIGAVGAIFMVGQMVEGNILTPKLVGNSVGLHPVWLIFALSAFGALFGFVGLLVAVPVTASLGVIARFGIDHYKSSRLYKGLSHDQPVDSE
ncbi:AI-2E family transporter [Actibacterium sp. 188UL27-1]|uniref:AI-2E family transporter n=1 Tax=Actibacterium sp. 188UL27-1 TaxID=2786961 RepID=UPI0019593706|nr:AI-2E family transporter [Actibacterium sp. 188UL27-1]MBM7069551.1 AI-2E family transporter [Actibacterium sp. 188UL27-1]